jgi:hypothetical protein
MRERRGALRVLVEKPERKRPLRRPKHSWEDIKMYLQELEKGGKDWIDLAQDKDSWQAPV